MKILIVCHYFYPHVGGIELVAYNQAKQLAKSDNKVTVLTTKVGNEKDKETIDGIRIIRTGALNILENKLGIPYPLISPKFVGVLKEEIAKADLVHIHGHVFTTSILASFIAKILKKPILVTQHSTYVHYKNPLIRFAQSSADKTLGRYTFAAADQIIAVSEKTKEYVQTLLPKNNKVQVVYNGVDLNRFKPQTNKQKIKSELGVGGKFVCLCIRRITFKNGIANLLKTAQKLSNQKNIVFLIGGKGPDFEKVKEYIEKNNLKNVRLLGFVPDADLPKYYAASDLFILPSQVGEGFPLVVLESFSSGVPVIATKSGGHVEVVKNENTGYLTQINNPNQIAQKIVYLYKAPKMLKKMSENCRTLIVEKLSWKSNAIQMKSIYKNLI